MCFFLYIFSYLLGIYEYAESCTSYESQANLILTEDESDNEKPTPPQSNGSHGDLYPVHDDDNDSIPSRYAYNNK